MLKIALRVAVSVGLVAALLLLLPVDRIWASIRSFDLRIWITVLLGFLVGHRIGAEKWRMLLRAGGTSLSSRSAVSCYAGGLFANLYLPTIVGGDVLRAALAARGTRRLEAVVLGGVADRVIDVGALVLLVLAGGLAAGSSVPGWGGHVMVLGAALTIVVLLVALPLVTRTPLSRWPRKLRRPVGRFLVALRRLSRRPGTAVKALGLALAMQAGFVALGSWIGYGVGIDIPWTAWFLAWPLAKAAGLLPVSIGGLGVRDAALGGLLVPLGVPMELGVTASFIWQSVLIVGGLLAGLAWRILADEGPVSLTEPRAADA